MAGKRLHEYLEEYLLWDPNDKEKWPDDKKPIILTIDSQEARTARAMLAFLPAPPQTRVEEPFTCEIDGTKWRGVKDLVYYEGNTLVIHDHKSTSSLEWAKKPEDLRRDIQSVIYARDAFREADVVDLQWLYGTRQHIPKVLPVRFNITFEEVTAALPPILEAGKRVLKLYDENPDPRSLPKSLDMCHAFGKPCPFMDECGLTLAEQVKALQIQSNIKEEKKMGFRDRKVAEVTEVKTTESMNKPSMAERLGFGSSTTPPPYVKPEPVKAAESTKVDEMVPDAPPISEESVAATKPRRGRPPGAKNKAAVETIDSEKAGQFQNAALASIKPIRDVSTKDLVDAAVVGMNFEREMSSKGFTLLVNVVPVGLAYTTLSEYLSPVLDAVQTRNDVAHYRLIDYKAGGMLAAALYSELEANPPTGFLFVDANTDEGRDCLPTLERFAKETYRSTK